MAATQHESPSHEEPRSLAILLCLAAIAGSRWNVSGDVTVGLSDAGPLNISDGGMVAAQEIVVNDLSDIVMNQGNLGAGSNLNNEGMLHFESGSNQVFGPVTNLAGGEIIVDEMATAIF